MEILKLFLTFFKIGAFTFGGGIAMLPILKEELIKKHKWITEQELMEYFVIGQITPGIIAVNTATLVGLKISGKKGAFFSTLGILLPSFFIIILISTFIKNFSEIYYLKNILSGIKIAVSALILNTVLQLLKTNVNNKLSIIIFSISLLFFIVFNMSPLIIIILSIIFSLTYTIINIYKMED